MILKKDCDDADLFLHFVRRAREPSGDKRPKITTYTDCLSDDKYRCIYCGCEYVYRRSLISHLKKLHNVTNVQ